DYDVIIDVGEGSDKTQCLAHSIILKTRSEYFRVALSFNWAKKEGDYYRYSKPNITSRAFDAVLKYLYVGTIDVSQENPETIFSIILALDEMQLYAPLEVVQKFFVENYTNWIDKNPVKTLEMASTNDNLSLIKEYIEKIICQEPEKFFQSTDFVDVKENSLISLLERDDLVMREVDIWEALIKWGKSVSEDSDNDLSIYKETLRTKLEKCINHVRFCRMTSAEYALKVREPYKWLLPNDLDEEIVNHFLRARKASKAILVQPRRRHLNTTFIVGEQISYVYRWIMDRESSTPDTLPDFKLIFKADRDGWDTFRQKCQGKEKTLVLIKVRDAPIILGGYNPVTWDVEQQTSATSPDEQRTPALPRRPIASTSSQPRISPLATVTPPVGPPLFQPQPQRNSGQYYRPPVVRLPPPMPQVSSFKPALHPQFGLFDIPGGFNKTSSSFIFMFQLDSIPQRARIIDSNFAIDPTAASPKFGRSDLHIEGKMVSCSPIDYEPSLSLDGKYAIIDYEVHQVQLP
ncbi:4049_t:CDS:2, partial [Paraglomus occultum]